MEGAQATAWPHRVLPGGSPCAKPSQISSTSRFLGRTGSAVGPLMDTWLRSHDVRARRVVSANNLVALAGLTLAGLGISYLPRRYFADLVRSGSLEIVRTDPPVPKFTYYVAHRRARQSAFLSRVAEACARVCDFERSFVSPTTNGRLGRDLGKRS